MIDLKQFTDYLIKNRIDQVEGLRLIKNTNKLENLDKLTVKSYVYPRSILDYELPKYIQEAGGDRRKEIRILIEAYRCPQYSRFMKHLMYAFLNLELLSSIEGFGDTTCPVCGRKIYYHESWDSLKDPGQETLAIMSKDSSVCMCKRCLSELIETHEIVIQLDGYDFLNKKNASNKD